MANPIPIVAQAVQGAKTGTFTLQAGNPAGVRVDMVSTVFPTDATLTFDVLIERSFDGGGTFEGWYGSSNVGGKAGLIGKDGQPIDGLYHQGFSWDGLACVVRITLTPNRAFNWGLTATLL